MEAVEFLSVGPGGHKLDSVLSVRLGGPLGVKGRAEVRDANVVLKGGNNGLVPGLSNEGLELLGVHGGRRRRLRGMGGCRVRKRFGF